MESDFFDVTERLEELALLKDGWLDGQGVALSKTGLNWLTRLLRESYPRGTPPPLLFPTIEGGVLAEWSAPPWEISAEFDLQARTVALSALNVETQESEELELNLSNEAELGRVADFVTRFQRETVKD